ncbi:Uncharacterized protein dnl_27200 [Desulfonema limicola]|uniref:UDP-N-acetylglucosamine pyrophosphorylase n=1 Tax=Desulfonema limicola TaxID=45656 RepID=A0A975B850_9BACT|nr:protein GlmU [Desulfonema limicola]QTA80417.1 Uncharacterized protein dnl_27200 [Desulfonema limicola]
MNDQHILKINKLLSKGVKIPTPQTIEIGEEVDIERISAGVKIYPGCRIYGKSTLILQGAELGYEGPVTVKDCQIGPDVKLKAGFFDNAVFLEKAEAGSGSHVRGGTILEEEAGIAHTVGLKQTILFPFVTLGSLINFCDCFMAGGTSRKDHSEVGSSYIHFNYTPNQDKATASLLGDVPRGVMLNQRPIFLGGQGGLVGPCRLEYGSVIAAGCVYRKDEPRPGRLLMAGQGRAGSIPFTSGIYQGVKRIILNNIIYIANLIALMQWYENIRYQFISPGFPDELLTGLKDKLNMGITERIKRLNEFAQKMPESLRLYQESAGENASQSLIAQKKELNEKWPELKAYLNSDHFDINQGRAGDLSLMEAFMKKIDKGIEKSGKKYIRVIKGLEPDESETGTRWLQRIVDRIVSESFEIIPAFGSVNI